MGGGWGGWGVGGQGGCERRIKVFVKIPKKKFFLGGGGWGGVRVDVNEELNFFCGGGGGGGSGSGEVRLGGSGWWGGWGGWVWVDVKSMLGIGGDVGYGGCEPRVEGIVQGTKRYCTIIRK